MTPGGLLSPTLRRLDRQRLPRELGIGITVAALTLPSALGYAQVAGLPAVYGLYAALAAMVVFGLFGGNRNLVFGPDATYAALIGATLRDVAGGDAARAAQLGPTLALLVGVAFVGLGLARAGFLANFLSKPLLAGFMTGLAVTIIVGQLPKLLGLSVQASSTVGKAEEMVKELDQTSWRSVVLGVVAFVLALWLGRLIPRVPVAAAILVGGLAVVGVFHLDSKGVATLGEIPQGLPTFALPRLNLEDLRSLASAAIALAAVGFADAVLQGRQYAATARFEPTPDRDMVAAGVANLACSVTSGFPVGASASRSAASMAGGGRTTFVSLSGGLLVGLTLLVLAPFLGKLPLPVLAAVIIASAVRLVSIRRIAALWPRHRTELAVAVAAALGVIVLGVLPGVAIAAALALIDFVVRAASPHSAVLGRRAGRPGWYDIARHDGEQLPGIVIFRFDAPVFFANADVFRTRVRGALAGADPPAHSLVLDAPAIGSLDATAIDSLRLLLDELAEEGVRVAVSGATGKLRDALVAEGLFQRHDLHKTIDEAVATLQAW